MKTLDELIDETASKVKEAIIREQRKELNELKAKIEATQKADFKAKIKEIIESVKGPGKKHYISQIGLKRGPYKKKARKPLTQATKDKISDARKELFKKRRLEEQAQAQKVKEQQSKGF